MNQHSTNQIFLIKPANFAYNLETSTSNAFQNEVTLDAEEIKTKVFAEFDAMANLLLEKGIDVHIIEDTDLPIKPDAIFPNNWIDFPSTTRMNVIFPEQHSLSERSG